MHAYSVIQLCLTLHDPMDCSLPGSSVHGIFQARTLEWVAFPLSGDLPDLGLELESPVGPTLAGGVFYPRATLGTPYVDTS